MSATTLAQPVQVILKLYDGYSEHTVDNVQISVVKSEYDVHLGVYIPYDWVNIRLHAFHLNEVAGGDLRTFDPLSLSYRLKQISRIIPFPELSSSGFPDSFPLGGINLVGVSIHYDIDSSLTTPSPLGHHQGLQPGNILSFLAKSEAEIETNKGAPYKTNWGRAIGDSLKSENNYVGIKSSYTFSGSEPEPIILWAADIDWVIDFEFDTTDPTKPTCEIFGNTDGFPAYEAYAYSTHSAPTPLNRADLLDWAPPLSNTVLDLTNSPDTPLSNPPVELK